jgi:hypothetical protein
MSVAPIRKARLADEAVVALLTEIRDVLRDMRAQQQRKPSLSVVAVPALIAALSEYFGPARFTVGAIMQVIDEAPHSALAEAVAQAIDMNARARSRATALGAFLVRLPEVECVASSPGIYRLRRE